MNIGRNALLIEQRAGLQRWKTWGRCGRSNTMDQRMSYSTPLKMTRTYHRLVLLAVAAVATVATLTAVGLLLLVASLEATLLIV